MPSRAARSAPAKIQRPALLAMVNKAALLLAQGVVSRGIDVVLVPGYGFPSWEGGPVFWAPQQEQTSLDQGLVVLRLLGFQDDDERVNAWGRAIALGHPLGASDPRLATTAGMPAVAATRCALCASVSVRASP